MRFTLTLELEKSSFPIDYRSIVLSFIKNAISKCNDGKYYDRFFKDTNQKDYCFSVILPKSRFTKDEIKLENNKLKILFSTGDAEKTGLILFNAFSKVKSLLQSGVPCNFATVVYATRKNASFNFCIFKTIRPARKTVICPFVSAFFVICRSA